MLNHEGVESTSNVQNKKMALHATSSAIPFNNKFEGQRYIRL